MTDEFADADDGDDWIFDGDDDEDKLGIEEFMKVNGDNESDDSKEGQP